MAGPTIDPSQSDSWILNQEHLETDLAEHLQTGHAEDIQADHAHHLQTDHTDHR